MLFTWEWWLGLALIILPWLLWIKYRKKESSDRLLYAGFFVLIISSWLDYIGTTFGLWYYRILVVPTPPPYIIWDFCLMPVTVRFFIQVNPQIKPFTKSIMFAVLTAFIGEPIFSGLGFVVQKHWEHYYSFPIEIVIYLSAYYISKRKNFAEI